MKAIKWTTALSIGVLGAFIVGFSIYPAFQDHNLDAHSQQTTVDDARPLKNLMVGLGQDMSRVSDGVWLEDFVMIGTAAGAIANHPKITAREMGLIKAQLGERFPQFVSFDQVVHGTAVELVEVAKAQDMSRVLELQGKIAQACYTCHATFRSEVKKAFAAAEVNSK